MNKKDLFDKEIITYVANNWEIISRDSNEAVVCFKMDNSRRRYLHLEEKTSEKMSLPTVWISSYEKAVKESHDQHKIKCKIGETVYQLICDVMLNGKEISIDMYMMTNDYIDYKNSDLLESLKTMYDTAFEIIKEMPNYRLWFVTGATKVYRDGVMNEIEKKIKGFQ